MRIICGYDRSGRKKRFTLEAGKRDACLEQMMKDLLLQKHSFSAVSGESLWQLGDDVQNCPSRIFKRGEL